MLIAVLPVLFLTTGHRPDCAEQSTAATDTAARALGAATALAGHLLNADSAAAAGLADGCYVWQQPGVALVITGQWSAGAPAPELWLDNETLTGLLTAQAGICFTAPFIYPSEAEYGPDGDRIEPVVCLLGADQARQRFQQHYAGYRQWVSLNDGLEFVEPDLASVDFCQAVVFIHSGGALEFYYTATPDGGLRLTQLFNYSYFSA